MKDKIYLRKKLMSNRLSYSSSELSKMSEIILNVLSNHVDWFQISTLHIYRSLLKYKEIDTQKLIESLRQIHPGIDIKIAPQEPNTKIPTGSNYDLVIVPVLGFDRRGFRLGYGGGYYDKFIARNDCKQIIGLAYSFSEIDKIPDESHDQKMQTIITEKEIIEIN